MSLSFGLNTKPKAKASPPKPKRRPVAMDVLGDDSDDDTPAAAPKTSVFEEELTEFDSSKPSRPSAPAPPPTRKPLNKLKSTSAPTKPPTRKPPTGNLDEFSDLSAQRESAAYAAKATELDPTIYDYDSFHSAATSAASVRKAAAKQDTANRGPKYMDALLTAAAQRKQDQQVAREKFLQKERENEGEEFADKETFVTGAYKAQQEENQRLREEEEKKAALEEERKRKMGGGMQGFYRNVMADSDRRHQEALEATAEMEKRKLAGDDIVDDPDMKQEKDRVAELAAKGVNIALNDEGQVADKRQLLTAGLNVLASPAAPPKPSATIQKQDDSAQWNKKRDNGVRERQTRMMELQLEESRKRALEADQEEQERLEKASKSKKSDTDISSARERFLARKREKEEAAKKKAA
jgi:coiled-coil domain-containing protein 55